MTFGPALAALALGYELVFFFELIGCIAERFFCFEKTRDGLAAEA
jgi:hypothetical protein